MRWKEMERGVVAHGGCLSYEIASYLSKLKMFQKFKSIGLIYIIYLILMFH